MEQQWSLTKVPGEPATTPAKVVAGQTQSQAAGSADGSSAPGFGKHKADGADGQSPPVKKTKIGQAKPYDKKAVAPQALARQTKSQYNTTISQADMLIRNIGTDASWKWANNVSMNSDLLGARRQLSDIVDADAFLKCALSMDFPEVKKIVKPDEFDKGLKSFSTKLDGLIAALGKQLKLLVGQRQARCRVD
jgi:hypothetical protein